MKQIKALLLSTLLLPSVSLGFTIGDIKPTIGYDVLSHHMQLKEELGQGLFKSKYVPMSFIYAHGRLTENFGFEFGYHQTKVKKHKKHLSTGESGLGVKTSSNEGHEYHYRTSGPTASAIFFSPIPGTNFPGEVFFTAGVINKRIYMKDSLFMDNGVPQSPPLVRTFRARKTLLRLSGGWMHKVNDHFGIKTSVSWENTAKLKHIKPDENPGSSLTVGTRNTVNYGIGIYVNM